MPHTKSAEKRLRQGEKRKLRNRTRIRAIKKQLKSFLDLLKTGTVEQLQTEYSAVAKKLDRAAAKRTIHPNAAARKKSQLARKIVAKKTAK
ncbi:MAG: 30S ribosomal protein S20 [Gemmataceae bacterium]